MIYTIDSTSIRKRIMDEKKIVLQVSKFSDVEKIVAQIEEICKTDSLSYVRKFENMNGESVFELVK